MAQELLGRLYRALGQGIPGEEEALAPDVKEIEQAVFAQDGLLTGGESSALKSSLEQIPLILSPQDRRRLDILTHGGFTLNRYFQLLAKEGLKPSNPKEELIALSQKSVPDYIYDVVRFEAHQGQVEIDLRSPEGRDLEIRLPLKAPKTKGEWADVSRSIRPLSIDELMLALANHQGKILTEYELGNVKSYTRHWLEAYLHNHAKLIRENGCDVHTNASTAQWQEALKEKAYSSTSLEGFLPEVGPVFQGDKPTPVQMRALQLGWGAIPEEVRDLLMHHGYRIHLVGDETFKEMGDSLPNLKEGPQFVGLFDPSSYQIYLHKDVDPAYLMIALVHECGHAFHHYLSNARSGEYLKGSAHDEVLAHHFGRVIRHGNYLSAPTIYGSTNQNEWFAEMFALSLVSDKNIQALGGYRGMTEEFLGIQYLFDRARKRDALGLNIVLSLILVEKFGYYSPECFLNWEDYPHIPDIRQAPPLSVQGATLLAHFEALTPALLVSGHLAASLFTAWVESDLIPRFFTSQGSCTPADEAYRQVLSAQFQNEAERTDEFYKQYEKYWDYHPFDREMTVRTMRGYLMPDTPTAIENDAPDEENFIHFEELVKIFPEDTSLQDIVSLALLLPLSVEPGAQWGKLKSVPNIEARWIKMGEYLQVAFPDSQAAKFLAPLILIYRGDYQEALNRFKVLEQELSELVQELESLKKDPLMKAKADEIEKNLQQNKFWFMRLTYKEAEVLALQGRRREAIHIFEGLKDHEGKLLHPSELADLYFKEGRLGEFEELAAKVQLYPVFLSTETLKWLAENGPWLGGWAGHYEKRLRYLEESGQLHPGNL